MNDGVAATSLRNGNGKSVVEAAPDPMLADHGVLLSALLELLQGVVHFKDLQGRFVLINRAMAEVLKVGSPVEAVGKSDFDFLPQSMPAQHSPMNRRSFERAARSSIRRRRKLWGDGRITWASTTKMPLLGKDGRIIGTFGISRDVTESRLMREALIEREARLASASEELTTVSQSMVASAGETAMLADFLSGANQQVSTTVSSVACAASQVKASIREISKNANDSRTVAQDAVDLAASAKDSMKKLETSSHEIHKVNKVINSIADERNRTQRERSGREDG